MTAPESASSARLEKLRQKIQAEVGRPFDWIRPGPLPWCPPGDLSTLRVALVTTGGLHGRQDPPFDEGQEGGDVGFRLIPHGFRPFQLALDQPYVDQKYVASDPQVALPTRALDQLVEQGICAGASPRHYSFCGGIIDPLPRLNGSAAELADHLKTDGVGAVVLLPTCPVCVQTVCLLARLIEAESIATVCLSLLAELSAIVQAPRTLVVRFPFGAPAGDPTNYDLHAAVLGEALALLQQSTGPGTTRHCELRWRR